MNSQVTQMNKTNIQYTFEKIVKFIIKNAD